MTLVTRLGSWVFKGAIGFSIALGMSPAQALPGQSTAEVSSWMQANPTVKPRPGETLFVQKFDSAAQSFSFQASLFAPGKMNAVPNGGVVRSEILTLFDVRNGVTFNRLRESLRSIYGLEVSQDFDRARVVHSYPTDATIEQALRENKPQLAYLQGELRQGDRYAYWFEIAQTEEGRAYSGRMTVFLKDDVKKLETELKKPWVDPMRPLFKRS